MQFWQLSFCFLLAVSSGFYFAFANCNFNVPDDDHNKTQAMLRVMTFNLWYTGEAVADGAAKITKHLKAVNPDIVLFQECRKGKFATVISNIGWNASYVGNDTTVATKHEIKTDEMYRIDDAVSVVPIFVPALNVTVIVVNQHLWFAYDGAVTLLINKDNKSAEERIQRAMSIEKSRRLVEQKNVLSDERFQKMMAHSMLADSREIIILGGDFNTPSHLDWGEDTKQKHDNFVFEWPVTKLVEQAGFVDSYRAVHKNASEEDGNTWSSVIIFNDNEQKYPEPQTRIDFLFYFDNGKVKAVNSEVYQGEMPVQKYPNHYYNDWPSDHRAVFTDFQVMPSAADDDE